MADTNKLKLSDAARSVLNSTGIEGIFKTYSTHYVHAIKKAQYMLGRLDIKCDTEGSVTTFQSHVNASVSGNYGVANGQASVSANNNNNSKSSNSNCTTTIKVRIFGIDDFTIGGDTVANKGADLQGMMDKLDAFETKSADFITKSQDIKKINDDALAAAEKQTKKLLDKYDKKQAAKEKNENKDDNENKDKRYLKIKGQKKDDNKDDDSNCDPQLCTFLKTVNAFKKMPIS